MCRFLASRILASRILDHRIKPLANRHARAPRGLPRGLERLGTTPSGLPRHVRCHAHIRVLNGEGPDGFEIVYRWYPDGAALCPRKGVFQPNGKQAVKNWGCSVREGAIMPACSL
jgi:hypothetical protein